MLSNEIRQRYLKFFEKRGHTIIPSAPLVPENDPSSLFITAGMQPLVPYLLGQKHPAGVRLVDVQKCVRTGDIEDVGDNRHLTFFEMMGNWSLGDYFKKAAIAWSLEFLTSKDEGLGLDPKRLYVTVFRGEDGIPRDEESIAVWKGNFSKFGINADVAEADEKIKDDVRIIPLGKADNFWIAGQTGPCGGDTEMFYDVVGKGKVEGNFQELVKSGRIIEIWNNVFMEFNKTADGKYEKLSKPNVDTGMGLERTSVVMQGKDNVFETDIFAPVISEIKKLAKNYNEKSARIIADHVRAATFIISDGVTPSNTEQGYVLRRLLRRAVRCVDQIGLVQENKTDQSDLVYISQMFVEQNMSAYPNLAAQSENIFKEIEMEEEKFRKTLVNGLKEFEKIQWMGVPDEKLPNDNNETVAIGGHAGKVLPGKVVFDLFQTYGFPIELTKELAKEKGAIISMDDFNRRMKEHQEISKAGSEQKFKGGLASTGEQETKYHTATHLLLGALRKVLNAEIVQKGSNITAERMRFDFNWPEKLTPEQLKQVEDLVNEKIAEKIPVEMFELPKEEAKKICTVLSFDLSKYGDIVKVYKVGNFDVEFCGGPHVKNTSELGHFKIVKEEASSAGVRRIKAILE
jgi:alanyl-tRNA synthetase